MNFLILNKMVDRLNVDKNDSEVAFFNDLLFLGEMMIKVVAAGLVAAVDDGREHYQYSQKYRLVRADGIGEWTQVIDEILTGLTSQFLIDSAREEQRELSGKSKNNSWQYNSVEKLNECIKIIQPDQEELSSQIKAQKWFSLFAILRNSTRGHGALLTGQCARMCTPLYESINIFIDNFCMFKRQWAYLHRSLSGKYKVIGYTDNQDGYAYLKTSEAQARQIKYVDGVYIYYDKPYFVDLLYTDSDSMDFRFPNGNFTNKNFEILSYITNTKLNISNENYLIPAASLPKSETEGYGNLDVQGESFGNIPQKQAGYIARKDLEKELYGILIDDRHPIITLFGRGGIGKTWLTLEILHKIAEEGKFDYILWFSSRDIDLLPEGPKAVKAHVQTVKEISSEFINLICPDKKDIIKDKEQFLADTMSNPGQEKYLFVFDNFETVKSPVELYNWIDTYIRLPNKVLITSRIRDFKGDFPIEVNGMNENESKYLIDKASRELNIQNLLTKEYKDDLFEESRGHPYVIKVLLGEVAKERKIGKIERIISSMDTILEALFERTYANLSPAAKRIFLTLCAWRSPVARLALEAVLLRPVNEMMNVTEAIKELKYSSFLEESNVENINEQFLSIPLVASEFGKKKLLTYQYNGSVMADLEIIRFFGATQETGMDKGFKPRFEQLIKTIRRIVNNKEQLCNDYSPMLEFLSSRHVSSWLLLADLYKEYSLDEKSIEALNRYLEAGINDDATNRQVWTRLVDAYDKKGDFKNEMHALIELAKVKNTDFYIISDSVNKINGRLRTVSLDQDEKRILLEQLVTVMENRISEGDADDYSRLAWLYMSLRREDDARRIALSGLTKEDNIHCRNIIDKLDTGNWTGINIS
jgi:hypothetical protein